jgi:hypothetical protein
LDYVSYVKEHPSGVNKCVKGWIFNLKRATRMGRGSKLLCGRSSLNIVIVSCSSLKGDHLVTHENCSI